MKLLTGVPLSKSSPRAPAGPSVVLIEGTPCCGRATVRQKSAPDSKDICQMSHQIAVHACTSVPTCCSSESFSMVSSTSLSISALRMSFFRETIRRKCNQKFHDHALVQTCSDDIELPGSWWSELRTDSASTTISQPTDQWLQLVLPWHNCPFYELSNPLQKLLSPRCLLQIVR